MNEKEYISLSDLIHARAAKSHISELLLTGSPELKKLASTIIVDIYDLVDARRNDVNITED